MNGLTFATVIVYYIYLFLGVIAVGIAGIVIGLLMKFVFWAEEKLKDKYAQWKVNRDFKKEGQG